MRALTARVGWVVAIQLVVAALAFVGGTRWGRARMRPPPTRPVATSAGGASRPAARPPSPAALPPAGEFERGTGLIVGCNELVRYHPEVFAGMVRSLPSSLPVIGLVGSRDELDILRRALEKRGLAARPVNCLLLPINSMWVRDYGPLFVRRADGSVVVADPEYSEVDSAGDRPQDDDMPRHLARLLRLPAVALPLRLEGGNLLSNGDGLAVTTTALIARNADRGYDVRAIGRILADRLGFRSWTYVRQLVGEPTGHVDMFVAFLAPNVAVVGRLDPAVDAENAEILDDAARLLDGAPTSRGPVKVHRIPMPPVRDGEWRSYTNIVLAGGTVLVPTFSDVDAATQNEALDLYARLLPGWKVKGVCADSMSEKRGLLHCVTINVPRYVSLAPLLGQPAGPDPGAADEEADEIERLLRQVGASDDGEGPAGEPPLLRVSPPAGGR